MEGEDLRGFRKLLEGVGVGGCVVLRGCRMDWVGGHRDSDAGDVWCFDG